MATVPGICTQCGAKIVVDNFKEAGICEYCGTAFITEKAINTYNVVNNINLNTSGNTINIIYQTNEPVKQDTNRFSDYYTITIRRKSKVLKGIAIIYVFDVDGVKYELRNGGDISFKTNLKNINFQVLQKTNFDDQVFYGQMTGIADGKDITIDVEVGLGFNKFTIKTLHSSNNSILIK